MGKNIIASHLRTLIIVIGCSKSASYADDPRWGNLHQYDLIRNERAKVSTRQRRSRVREDALLVLLMRSLTCFPRLNWSAKKKIIFRPGLWSKKKRGSGSDNRLQIILYRKKVLNRLRYEVVHWDLDIMGVIVF